ncbi:MAG: hypothetical protein AB7G47_09740 [Mycolicibacterium sp.]|uniref:hypothetical protein n=1 Tax=Mycolicibacterium sp. TaxID=2320850 RepID=UPI003D0D571F
MGGHLLTELLTGQVDQSGQLLGPDNHLVQSGVVLGDLSVLRVVGRALCVIDVGDTDGGLVTVDIAGNASCTVAI